MFSTWCWATRGGAILRIITTGRPPAGHENTVARTQHPNVEKSLKIERCPADFSILCFQLGTLISGKIFVALKRTSLLTETHPQLLWYSLSEEYM
jgi:hypothetical protein